MLALPANLSADLPKVFPEVYAWKCGAGEGCEDNQD